MVDAIDSKSVIRKGVRVQVPSPVKIRTGQSACPDFYFGDKWDLKPCGRRATECCPKQGRPVGATFLLSAGGQVPSPES